MTARERYERHAREAEAVERALTSDPTFTMPAWDDLSPILKRVWRSEIERGSRAGERGYRCRSCLDTGRYVDGGPCPDC